MLECFTYNCLAGLKVTLPPNIRKFVLINEKFNLDMNYCEIFCRLVVNYPI